MSSASNNAADNALPPAPDGIMGESPGPTTAARLKMVNTSLSESREHILVHFVSIQDHVITVQLEIAFTTRFHQNLGTLLGQLRAMETPQPLRD